MKIAAHPLVVAVALGLLDPAVLATRGLQERSRSESESRAPSSEVEPEMADIADIIEPFEFARLEAEWQQVRDLV